MRAEAKDLGTLYRAQRKVLSVDCVDDLLDLVSVTVSALYPGLERFELYVTDRTGKVTASRVQGSTDRKCIELPDLKRLRTADPGDDWSGSPGAVRRLRMSAPLLDGTAAAGLIVVEAAPGSPFAEVDAEILEAIAGLFSLALQRLRSEQREYRQAFIEQDLRSAGGVQRRLMTRTLPADSGVTIDARYIPALDVGGDFYDLAYLGNGRIGGAIGDVSGKGVSAALIMSGVASDLGRALRSGVGPAKVLENVNSTLNDVESETFVTASCIEIDSRNQFLTVANAGHLPLVVRRAGGEVLDFGAASGTPLGMVPCAYLEERLELKPLDIVFLMTDGLAEAFDCPDDRMGTRFLKRLVSSAPHDAKVVNDRILAAAHAKSGTRRLDDVTLVALQLEPR
jgi:phosphoserine phosphatase RsbU/P